MKRILLFILICISNQAFSQVSTASLEALASTFSVISNTTGTILPGKVIDLKISPWPVDLKLDNVIAGDLNLTWITKDVRFNNPNIEAAFSSTPFNASAIDAILQGGMPARVPSVGTVVGTDGLTGVPGNLSQLRGGLPIKVTVPVKVEVEWFITNKNGNVNSNDYIAIPANLKGPQLSVTFKPELTELTNSPSLTLKELSIRARVKLTVTGISPYDLDLPSIPFLIAPLPIPKIAVFFRHTSFSADDNGAALVAVPHNSPIANIASLQTTLNTVESAISNLRSIADFASLFLGINELQTALAAQPHVQFKRANGDNNINNFNNITLIQNSWYDNDVEAEDELSSLIFIAPSGGRVRCFNARSRDEDEGAFELRTGSAMFVLVKSLHSQTPSVFPSGSVMDILQRSTESDRFGDELSSLDFM